jgi:hypothetical protein
VGDQVLPVQVYFRFHSAITLLTGIYVFYTIPLYVTCVNSYVNKQVEPHISRDFSGRLPRVWSILQNGREYFQTFRNGSKTLQFFLRI